MCGGRTALQWLHIIAINKREEDHMAVKCINERKERDLHEIFQQHSNQTQISHSQIGQQTGKKGKKEQKKGFLINPKGKL